MPGHAYTLDRGAAAEYLGICRTTLDHFCGARKIAFLKLGKRSYFSKEDLDTFVESRRVAVDGARNLSNEQQGRGRR